MTDRRELLNDEQEALRLAMDGRLSSLWTSIPGIISKVDYEKRTCEVQPAIQARISKPNGTTEFVNLPLLVDVPIVLPSVTGFTLSLPIKAGDEVLVVFASRCIDSWWQSGGVGKPMEMRMHDLSDGFAIPGPRSLSKVTPIHEENFQITNDTQTAMVEITPAGVINLKAPTQINFDCPTVIFSGAIAASGNIQCAGANIGGKDFATHTHVSNTGSGHTGGVD